MISKKIIVLLLLSFAIIAVEGQPIKKFTHDTATFLEELETWMEFNDRDKKSKDIMESFTNTWYSAAFSPDQITGIHATTNNLLREKARSYPHFEDYLNILITFAASPEKMKKYDDWNTALNVFLDQEKVRIRSIAIFLQFSRNLISSNILYQSPSTTWKASNPNYILQSDNDKIKVSFDKTDLICYAKGDSIILKETSGKYDPLEYIWIGKKGNVSWERAGLPKDSVNATIFDYKIDMKRSYYQADSVKFINKYFFEESIFGDLNDKVMVVSKPERASYPRFNSYNIHFQIKNIFENIDYTGGFSMRGAKLIGSGSDQGDAFVDVYREIDVEENGEIRKERILFMKGASKYFVIDENEITGTNTSVSLYLDNDSIFHPGLLFRYYNNKRELNLIRDDNPNNMSRSPYFNTFHNIDMDFELLQWNVDEPNINITMLRGSAMNMAHFESINFFREQLYMRLQGMDDVHPFIILRNYARKFETETYTGLELSHYMRRSVHTVRQMLIRLSFIGVVDYDVDTDMATNKQRLYDYLDAVVGKKDYDMLDFTSTTEAPLNNATLNLKNYDLQIFGVPEIYVSDSQNVVIFPENQTITLKKNRDFDFAGIINAGYFTYFGHNFTFKYDSFLVDLNKIDSLRISVPQGLDNWGERMLANVQSTIEMVTGELRIDDPENKSGVKSFPQYPVFNSKEQSYVYYDRHDIHEGVYDRANFYFIMDPYKIDSINSFDPEGMGYDGKLVSNIFPDFRDKLILQDDNSLGFIRTTPVEGFPVYEGKGHYFDTIKLSNNGLEGKGYLNYLTSTTSSNEFIFFPDSTNAYAQRFVNEKKTSFPQYPSTDGKFLDIHWLPKEDELYATTLNAPMSMYEDQASVFGTVLLTPEGLTGEGKMNVEKAQMSDGDFTYAAESFSSDTVNLNFFTENRDNFTFKTKNVSTHVDFRTRKATIEANEETTEVDFPLNEYVAQTKHINWDIDNDDLELTSQNIVQIIQDGEQKSVIEQDFKGEPVGSHYISMQSEQDSLNFVSPVSNFDLKNSIINAHQVYFILVADGTVFPGDGEVVVEKEAKMRTLKNARVLANRDTKYHTFYNAMVNILGANEYNGSGKYNYVDENGMKQVIHFELFAVDDSINTFAKGKIPQKSNFNLSPYFAYYGKVDLHAKRKNLNFEGYTKISHDCDQIPEKWVKFSSEIDPNEIYIPISTSPEDQNGKDLYAGILMNTDSTHIFSTFLSPRKRYSDKYIVSANEYLYFDKRAKKYIISSKEKIKDFEQPGDYLSIHRTICNVYGEGKIDLNTKLGQLKTNTVGSVNHILDKNQVNLDLVMALDFFFDNPSLQIMADTLANSYQLPAVKINRSIYSKGIKELVGKEKGEELLKEASIFGTYKKFPEELNHTILLTDLNMEWNSETNSYRSTGKIGIGNVLQTQINKMVDGYVEIEKTRTGDAFGMYIELDRKTWFFFYYKRGLMQAYSSSSKFNEAIRDIKASKRKMDVPRGEESYLYFLSNMRKQKEFIRRFEEDDDYRFD